LKKPTDQALNRRDSSIRGKLKLLEAPRFSACLKIRGSLFVVKPVKKSKVFLMDRITASIHADIMQFSKTFNFLLPTDR